MLNILYITNNTGFCKFYRILYQAEQLRLNKLANVCILNTLDSRYLKEKLLWANVIVFQHGVGGKFISEISEICKTNKLGQLIVCDYDDDLKNTSPMNPLAYTHWGTEEVTVNGKEIYKDGIDGFSLKENNERISVFEELNRSVDLITVTTKELAEAYEEYGTPVEILPNYLNPQVMPPNNNKQKVDDVIKIVWQGGDSHFEDLMSVMPALVKIKEIYKHRVEFYFFGIGYKTPIKLVNGISIPWCEPELFYPKFSEYKFDIGIIPITDNKFNRGKSNIKYLEYSYYGIPSVVQNNIPYKQHIIDGVDGLLFDDNYGLFNCIQRLIENPVDRISIAHKAKQKVLKDCNIIEGDKFKKWLDVYEKHLKNKIKSYTT